MISFPQSIDNITSDWLIEALQADNLLRYGYVTNVQVQPLSDVPFGGPKIRRLIIDYSKDVDCDIPKEVILKISPKEKEFFFYTEITKGMENPPVPQCYFACQNEEKTQALFLLEDLSATHFQTEWPVPPTYELCETAIDCLSTFHAFLWNDSQLETNLREQVIKGNYWSKRLKNAIDKLPGFLDFIGDRLSAGRKRIYESILNSPNTYWMPDKSRNVKTFLHGDCHFWNFLFPKDKSSYSVHVFDWNSWDIGKGTNDLAYMIGLHWYPTLREQREQSLLKRYHVRLVEKGIANYSWDDCWLDYRESCLMNMFIPIWQWQHGGISAAVWWSHLERSFLTFDDLSLAELL